MVKSAGVNPGKQIRELRETIASLEVGTLTGGTKGGVGATESGTRASVYGRGNLLETTMQEPMGEGRRPEHEILSCKGLET